MLRRAANENNYENYGKNKDFSNTGQSYKEVPETKAFSYVHFTAESNDSSSDYEKSLPSLLLINYCRIKKFYSDVFFPVKSN